jgi:DNA-binding MarR family transcriptional regulator
MPDRMPRTSHRTITPRSTDPRVPGDDLPLEQYVTLGLLRLTNRLNRQSMQLLDRAAGLGLPEWRCLAFIGRADTISLNEITDLTGMDRGLISRSVQSLVEKGLVLVARDPADRRLVRAAMTRKGEDVYRAVKPVMHARQLRLLDSLDSTDRQALYRIMGRLTRCLDEWPADETLP